MPINPEEQNMLKNTAYKYGIAMVLLVINNLLAPIVFAVLLSLSGVRFKDGTNTYYAAIMLLNELSAYLFPILILRAVFSRERVAFAPEKAYERIKGESLLLFLGGTAAGSVGTIVTNLINSVIDIIFKTGEIPDAFSGMKPSDPFQLGVFMFCICVIAPICEEYLFRDILLKPLRRFHDGAAAIMSGLVFGLYHGNFDQFAYAALLGFFYSVIAVRAGSIKPTVLLHALNNLLVCLAVYLPGAVPEASDIAAIFSHITNLMFPAGLIALILIAPRGCFSFHSLLSGRELSQGFLRSPAVIIGFVVMLAVFFLG